MKKHFLTSMFYEGLERQFKFSYLSFFFFCKINFKFHKLKINKIKSAPLTHFSVVPQGWMRSTPSRGTGSQRSVRERPSVS